MHLDSGAFMKMPPKEDPMQPQHTDAVIHPPSKLKCDLTFLIEMPMQTKVNE